MLFPRYQRPSNSAGKPHAERAKPLWGAISEQAGGHLEKIQALATATATHLGLDLSFSERDFILHDAYGAPGYGVITDAEREAIRLLARTEGIIADPTYTGRALVRRRVYGPDGTVLFWHTGGVAGLFARAAELLD